MHARLAAVLLLATASIVSIPVLAQQPLQVVVVNYDEVWEFIVEPAVASIQPISNRKRSSSEKYLPQLTALSRDRDAKADFRRFAVAGLENPTTTRAKWAEFSPDCQFVVVGFEDPRYDVNYATEFGRPKPWVRLGELKLKNHNFLMDVAWSADSKFLVLLETEERYSKSPKAMASAAFGHPVPLETLFLTIIEVESGKKVRIKLLADVPYGSGFIDTKRPSCHQR